MAIYKKKCSSPLRLVIISLLAAVFVFGIGGIVSIKDESEE